MDITRTTRTLLVAAALGATTLTLASCGKELPAPTQDISVVVPESTPRHFEPACNTRAAVRPCPTPRETRNRMRFDDELAPSR